MRANRASETLPRVIVQAVAASDRRKYALQEPLQDNLRIALEALIGRLPAVGTWLAPPGVEILHKLVVLILLFVSVLDDQVKRIALLQIWSW